MVLTLLASPGTVGELAVPPRSPASWIFPLVVASASGVPEETVVSTYAFVAASVALLGVGTVTVPVKVGLARGAFKSRAVWVAADIGLLASEVLSTLPKPTSDLLTVMLAERACPLTVVETSTLFESPGTVGLSAVPLRSPVSFTFPLVPPSASGVLEPLATEST